MSVCVCVCVCVREREREGVPAVDGVGNCQVPLPQGDVQ